VDADPEIILPCLDEADALPAVLAALPPGWPVLVVDNGSTDATADVARALGARVVGGPRGVPVHDIAPIRVARRAALLDLEVADRAFGYPLELLLRAGAAGWRIAEFPVAYRARAGGRSKVSGSLRGTVRASRDMAGLLR